MFNRSLTHDSQFSYHKPAKANGYLFILPQLDFDRARQRMNMGKTCSTAFTAISECNCDGELKVYRSKHHLNRASVSARASALASTIKDGAYR